MTHPVYIGKNENSKNAWLIGAKTLRWDQALLKVIQLANTSVQIL
jgi:hypothetical protein